MSKKASDEEDDESEEEEEEAQKPEKKQPLKKAAAPAKNQPKMFELKDTAVLALELLLRSLLKHIYIYTQVCTPHSHYNVTHHSLPHHLDRRTSHCQA